MRQVLALMAFFVCGIGFGFAIKAASAASLPPLTALNLAHASLETVGYWRRYWRRHGYGPDEGLPDADAQVGADAGVDADAPAVIVLPPPRPLSCGEYRYWNGSACVDARYNNPYLGPK